MEACKFVGCFPSELYKKHDPTIGDYLAVSVYNRILREEEDERLNAMMGEK